MANINPGVPATPPNNAFGVRGAQGPTVVSVSNFPPAVPPPAVQAVHVTNQPPVQQVTVTNQQTSVGVNNFPSNQPVTVANPYLVTGSEDGGHKSLGATTDTAVSNPASPGTLVALLKGILSKFASAFAVTVNNFPATQLVSGAVSVNNFPATQPVSGSVSVNNFPSTQPISGSVSVSNLLNPQPVSVTNFLNPQPTREMMNTGRQQLCLSWENLGGHTSETLETFTSGSRNGVALPAASSYTVSAGKTLRIQSVVFTFGQNGSSACNYRARIRQGTTTAAPVILAAGAGGPSNTCNVVHCPVPDGLEVPSGQSICLTHIETATGGILSCCLVGFEY